MKFEFKKERNIWAVYFLTVFLTIYFHEIGHCIPAWANGIKAIPTPAKEYISETISDGLQQQVSLGGVLGTLLISIFGLILYLAKHFKYNSAVLAGAIAMPAMYTFRFILAGRGHDANEFQEAQAALGAAYSGHLTDWVFLFLFLAGVAVWIIKSQPKPRIAGRLAIGFVVTVIFVIVLQVVNNTLFDPVFQ